MLSRSQVKYPIIVMLSLSMGSLLTAATAASLSGYFNYFGLTMETSSATLCSIYLTLKLQINNTYVYSIIFVATLLTISFLISVIAYLFWLRFKYSQTQQQQSQFQHFSLSTFYLLYLLYSLALLSIIPSVSYYLTFIIEKGEKCTSSYITQWFSIGACFIFSFILLFACWIYLLFLKLKFENKQEEEIQLPIIEEIKKAVNFQPTMKEFLQQILLKQKMQRLQQEKRIQQLRQPLIEQVDESDKISQSQRQKQKCVVVGYDQYKRKQDLIKKKEEEQEKQIMKAMKEEEEKREEQERIKAEEALRKLQLKMKLSSMALSPQDQDFDEMFQYQSEKQEEAKVCLSKIKEQTSKNKQQKQEFYPANYVPTNEQEELRFKKYKKKLLKQIKLKKGNKNNKIYKRHPQNIEGGRSKRQLQSLINLSKKPLRNQQLYKNKEGLSNIPNSTSFMQMTDYYSDDQQSIQSATFNVIKQQDKQKESLTANQPIKLQNQISFNNQREPQEQESIEYRVITIRQRTKSPIRKKLFDEETNYFKNVNKSSVLGNTPQELTESPYKRRLRELRQQREGMQNHTTKRKNEKLIDFIRFKYN